MTTKLKAVAGEQCLDKSELLSVSVSFGTQLRSLNKTQPEFC